MRHHRGTLLAELTHARVQVHSPRMAQSADGTAPSVADVPEISPVRLDMADAAGIRARLVEDGFACVQNAVSEAELQHARELLWQFLQGDESPRMTQTRPVGWERADPSSWLEGHGDALMTATTHCVSVRTRRSCMAAGGPCDRTPYHPPATSGAGVDVVHSQPAGGDPRLRGCVRPARARRCI